MSDGPHQTQHEDPGGPAGFEPTAFPSADPAGDYAPDAEPTTAEVPPAPPAAFDTQASHGRGSFGMLAGWACAAVAAGVAGFLFFQGENATAAPDGARRAARPAAEPIFGGKALAKVTHGGETKTITYDLVAAEAMDRYAREVLDAVINRTTIELACKRAGVSVSPAEIEQEITAVAKKFELDRGTYLQMLQTERNLTPAQYRRDVIGPKLALQKLAGTEVSVTPDDVKRAFIRTYGPRVKARMIMCDNPRRAFEAHAEAVKPGADFGKLARERSVDQTSQALDGVVPPIPMYGSPETAELEKAAFALKPGEVSSVIQLSFPGMNRWVILKSEGFTEPAATKIEDVRGLIEESLREEKVQIAVAEVFQKIQAGTTIHNMLTGETTGGGKASAAPPADPATTLPTP